MEKITTDDIMALRPCLNWPAGRVRAAVGAGVTYRQIAEADHVGIADRRWLLTRLAARTAEGRRALVLWAAGCAQDVRHLIADEDARDAADYAIQNAVAWTEGAADEDDCRAAAATAAYAAAAYYAAAADRAAARAVYVAAFGVTYAARAHVKAAVAAAKDAAAAAAVGGSFTARAAYRAAAAAARRAERAAAA